MKLLQRVIGPVATNLFVLGDEPSREAIAIDTATPCVEWLTTTLAERGWTLKLIVSTHRHWDHIGDNAPLSAATGAQIAAHIARSPRARTSHGAVRAVPGAAVDPGDRPGRGLTNQVRSRSSSRCCTRRATRRARCVCWRTDERLLFSGDTLFAGAWGRTDLPGGSDDQMVDSLSPTVCDANRPARSARPRTPIHACG